MTETPDKTEHWRTHVESWRASGLILHGRHWRLEFPEPPAADWLSQLLGRLK